MSGKTETAVHDQEFAVTRLPNGEVREGTTAGGFRSVRLVGYERRDLASRAASAIARTAPESDPFRRSSTAPPAAPRRG